MVNVFPIRLQCLVSKIPNETKKRVNVLLGSCLLEISLDFTEREQFEYNALIDVFTRFTLQFYLNTPLTMKISVLYLITKVCVLYLNVQTINYDRILFKNDCLTSLFGYNKIKLGRFQSGKK